MFYDDFNVWWWPFVFILLAGVLPTAIWRWVGVFLIKNVDDDSDILVFVRCVASALLAALIGQFVFYPSGALALIPGLVRFAAAACGFAAFLLTGGRLLVAILAGELVLVAGYILF